MPKQKPTPSGKRAKPGKKKGGAEPDPEWEHLEERYNSLNSDFNKLKELMEKQ